MSRKLNKINQEILHWWCFQKERFFYKHEQNLFRHKKFDQFLIEGDKILFEPSFIHVFKEDSKVLGISLNPSIYDVDIHYYKQDLCTGDRFYNKSQLDSKIDEIKRNEIKAFLKNECPKDFGIFHQIKDYYEEIEEQILNMEHFYLFQMRANSFKQIPKMLGLDNKGFILEEDKSFGEINIKHAMKVFEEMIDFYREARLIIFNDAVSSSIIHKNFDISYDTDVHCHYYHHGSRKIYLLYEGIMGNTYLDNIFDNRLIDLVHYALDYEKK